MKKVIYGVLAFAPVLAFAQNISGLQNLVSQIGAIIRMLIPIMFALAIVYFFWGMIKFIRSAGDPKAAAEGRSIMIYGVIAIAVMVSIYGLVGWLQTTLGVTSPTTITLPTVPTQ
jgi:hypothetical protein